MYLHLPTQHPPWKRNGQLRLNKSKIRLWFPLPQNLFLPRSPPAQSLGTPSFHRSDPKIILGSLFLSLAHLFHQEILTLQSSKYTPTPPSSHLVHNSCLDSASVFTWTAVIAFWFYPCPLQPTLSPAARAGWPSLCSNDFPPP